MDLSFAGDGTVDGQLAILDGQVSNNAVGYLPALYAGVGHAAGQRQAAALAHLNTAPVARVGVGHQPGVFQHQGAAAVADGGEGGLGGGVAQAAIALQDHGHLIFGGASNAVDHSIADRGTDKHSTTTGNTGVNLFQFTGYVAIHCDGSAFAGDAQISLGHIQFDITQRQVVCSVDVVACPGVTGCECVAAALDGQRFGRQFNHAIRTGGTVGFQRHIVQ